MSKVAVIFVIFLEYFKIFNTVISQLMMEEIAVKRSF